MSIKPIITTSGFILPDNEHFTSVFTNDKESLSKLKSITPKDNLNIRQLIDKVYYSKNCDLVYAKYINNPSYENLLDMVLITCDIIKDISVKKFFLLQASSKFLSPISFQFCRDIVNDSYLKDFRKYNVVPCTIRSDFSLYLTNDEFRTRANTLDRETLLAHEWENFLPELIENKTAFVTFFKYIFVDNY